MLTPLLIEIIIDLKNETLPLQGIPAAAVQALG